MALFKIFKRVNPIFVIKLPVSVPESRMDIINQEMQKKLKGYYIIMYRDPAVKSIKFECYNCEINEIEFKELQKKLLQSINKETQP